MNHIQRMIYATGLALSASIFLIKLPIKKKEKRLKGDN